MTDSCPLCVYDASKTQLISVPSGTKSIKILSSVVTIYGANQQNYAFFNAASSLESFSFESSSKLQKITLCL